MTRLEELVYLSIGRASMCWSEIPRGTFNDVYAHQIAQELMSAFEEYAVERIKKDRAIQHLSTPHVIRDKDGNIVAQAKGSI